MSDARFPWRTVDRDYLDDDHRLLRRVARDFVDAEIAPHIERWEEAGMFDRDLYRKAAAVGVLGAGYPEEYGGSGGDVWTQLVAWEEISRAGSGGVGASLGSLDIAVPPILAHGTVEQKQRFLPAVLSGEKIAALAITEPSGGSDVANLKTTAVRDGEDYVVNGSKTFITSGVRADLIVAAVRTGGEGAHGISLVVIPGDAPGLTRSEPLKKMGWWASDTAQLFFNDVRVPIADRIGEENQGFYAVMDNFQMERLMLAITATITAEVALEASLGYVGEREAFGRPLKGHQVIRHSLVEMATQVTAAKEFVYRVADRMNRGEDQVTDVSMAKMLATEVSDSVTDRAVQIFGGYGYMREYDVERLYRDNRILSIGGGTSEVMKEIVAKRIL